MGNYKMENLLKQYNPHWEKNKPYTLIPREKYHQNIASVLDRREILVLKGIRRSGKSSLLKLVINHLLKKKVPSKNILFMNLEDYRFGSDKSVNTLDEIYQTFRTLKSPKGKVYILLDEVQEVPNFEKWLRTYYEQHENVKFIITGSSSSLFSRELATLLTGRQISIEVFPFSFLEYLTYKMPKHLKVLQKNDIDSLYLTDISEKLTPFLQKYMAEGGFPEMLKTENPESNILALQQYISDILLRDIAQRYNIRKIDVLKKLTLYLIFNMGSGLNISRVAELVGSNRTTVMELIAYLKEVYMVFTTSGFSFNLNEQLNSNKPKKIYCIDNGFYTAINTESNRAEEKKFKNTVFQQIRFQWGESVFYWKEKVEIDFVLKNGFPIMTTADDAQLDKRVNALFYFLNHHNLSKGLLITWDRLQILAENNRTIIMMPLWIFLSKSKDEILNYTV